MELWGDPAVTALIGSRGKLTKAQIGEKHCQATGRHLITLNIPDLRGFASKMARVEPKPALRRTPRTSTAL
jgi:hypothetical protein